MNNSSENCCSNAKDLLEYLHGTESAARVATSVIQDIAVAEDLPELMHDLCTKLLVHSDWQTRSNAANLLGILTLKFEDILNALSSEGRNPDSILSVDEISIDRLLAGNVKLYSSESCLGDNPAIYSDKWLNRQTRELRKLLLLDVEGQQEIKSGLRLCDQEYGVDVNDFLASETSAPYVHSGAMGGSLDQRYREESGERRNWFIAIINYLTIGLLSPRWETRHGCGAGLSKIILSFLRKSHDYGTTEFTTSCLSVGICQDLVCFGVYALLLDRFIDCSEGSTAISPVKEATAQMVTLGARMLPAQLMFSDVLISMACQMASYRTEWMVRHGGLLILKYFILYHLNGGVDMLAGLMSRHSVSIFECIELGLRSNVEEIVCVSCEAIHAFGLIVKQYITSVSESCKRDLNNFLGRSMMNALRLLDEVASSTSRDVSSNYKEVCSAAQWCLKTGMYLAHDTSSVFLAISFFFNVATRLLWSGFAMKMTTRALADMYKVVGEAVEDVVMFLSNTGKCFGDEKILINSGIFLVLSTLLFSQCSEVIPSDSEPWLLGLQNDYDIQNSMQKIFLSVARTIYTLAGKNASDHFVMQIFGTIFSEVLIFPSPPKEATASKSNGQKRRKLDMKRYVDDDDEANVEKLVQTDFVTEILRVYEAQFEIPFKVQPTMTIFDAKRLFYPATLDESIGQNIITISRALSFFLAENKGECEAELKVRDLLKSYMLTASTVLREKDDALLEMITKLNTPSLDAKLSRPIIINIGRKCMSAPKLNVVSSVDALRSDIKARATMLWAAFFCALSHCLKLSIDLEKIFDDAVTWHLNQVIGAAKEVSKLSESPHTDLLPKSYILRAILNCCTKDKQCVSLDTFCLTALCIVTSEISTLVEGNGAGSCEDTVCNVNVPFVLALSTLCADILAIKILDKDQLSQIWISFFDSEFDTHAKIRSFAIGVFLKDNISEKRSDAGPLILNHFWKGIVLQYSYDSPRALEAAHCMISLSRIICSQNGQDLSFEAPHFKICLSRFVASMCIVLFSELDMPLNGETANASMALLKNIQSRIYALPTNIEIEKDQGIRSSDAAFRIFKRSNYGLESYSSILSRIPSSIGRIFLKCLLSRYIYSTNVCPIEEFGDSVSIGIIDLLHNVDNIRLQIVLYILIAVTLSCDKFDLSADLEFWTKIVLEGTNINSMIARRCSMLGLSVLVPLQPLGHMIKPADCINSSGVNLGELSQLQWSVVIAEIQRVSPVVNHIDSSGVYIENCGYLDKTDHILRSYQWIGVKWITRLWRSGFGGGILADEMGLGKSVQAIAAVLVRRIESNGKQRPSLIVCPPSLIRHWQSEIVKVVTNRAILRSMVVDNVTDEFLKTVTDEVILIASYTHVRQHSYLLSRIEFDVIILDEAHSIKNASSALAKAMFSFQSRRRLALTGTPVQNNVEDIYSIMHFLVPDFLGDYKSFRKSIVLPVSRYFRHIDKKHGRLLEQSNSNRRSENEVSMAQSVAGLDALHKLHQQILLFILRRKKCVVAADLPEKSIIDIDCPLSDIQRDMYETFQRKLHLNDDRLFNMLADVVPSYDETSVFKGNALQAVSYLKLLSVHPSLVIDQKMHSNYYNRLAASVECSGKLAMLLKVLVESGVVPAEEVSTQSGQDFLSSIIAPKILAGNHVPATKGERTTFSREVKLSNSGKIMPVFRGRTNLDNKEESEQSSTYSSDEVDEDCPRIQSVKAPMNEHLSSVKKCLIFAQHKSVLDLLENVIFKKFFPYVRYARLDGGVSPQVRSDIVDEFSNESLDQNSSTHGPIRILLMTARSCGLGLNLAVADTVIFVEMDWNPFVDKQAMDRAHRIGQSKPVTVFRLVADCTIEARIMSLQTRKEAIAAEVVNEDNDKVSSGDVPDRIEFNSSVWNTLSSVNIMNNPIKGGKSSYDNEFDNPSIDYECFNVAQCIKDFGDNF